MAAVTAMVVSFIIFSAYGNKRSLFVLFIMANTGSTRIQLSFAVHNKPVEMMSVAQFQALEPPAIEQSLHRKRMPMVEVAGDFNPLGVWRRKVEVDWLK